MADVGAGWYQGPGGYYSQTDHSGPYAISSAGVATLLAPVASGGGGGSSVDQSATNATSGQATRADNQHTISFEYNYNGTTWDAQRGLNGVKYVSQPDVRASAVALPAAVNSFIDIPISGQGTIGLKFVGLTASGATISFLSSNDPTVAPASTINSYNASTGTTTNVRTTDGETRISVSGRATLRLLVTTGGTGQINISYNVSAMVGIVDLASPIPAGTNTIGSIANTGFTVTQSGVWNVGLTGTLPAFASTPTVNVGTGGYSGGTATNPGTSGATATPVQGVTSGVPITVSWTGQTVAIGGTLPAFASPPTVNIGSGGYNGATAVNAGTNGATATPMQGIAGGVAVAVSGTLTSNQGTAGASPWLVSWTGQSVSLTGTLPAFATPPTVIQQDNKLFTVTATSAAPLIGTGTDQSTGAIESSGYSSIGVQVTAGSFIGLVEESNDNVTWYTISQGVQSTNAGSVSSTNGLLGIVYLSFPVTGKYFRIRASSYTSGTATVIVNMKIANVAPIATYVTPSVGTAAATPLRAVEVGSATAADAIVPAASATATSSQILKGSAGNLYGLNVVAGATAGFIMIFDATTAPADGTVTPKWCMPLAANAGYSGSPGGTPIGMGFTTGCVVVFSSTGPFTKTASATAFISGSIR